MTASLKIGALLVRNGMQYAYYDNRSKFFLDTMSPVPDPRIVRLCTHALGSGSGALPSFIEREVCGLGDTKTTHERIEEQKKQNYAAALKSSRPRHLTVAHCQALAGLLLYVKSQYQNLLLHLASSGLDPAAQESWAFVSQVPYETGPSDDSVARVGHHVSPAPQFTRYM